MQTILVKPDLIFPGDLLLGARGLFSRQARPEMEFIFLQTEFCWPNSKLEDILPSFSMTHLIPWSLFEMFLAQARKNLPNEIMGWMCYDPAEAEWELVIPDQEVGRGGTAPRDPFHPKGIEAALDIHSHGSVRAFFSPTDTEDETGFRVYVVVGSLTLDDAEPFQIELRVGADGNFRKLSLWEVFDVSK